MKEPKIKGRRDVQNQPNDKALDRLHQFEQERGLSPTEPPGVKADQPTRKRRKPAPV